VVGRRTVVLAGGAVALAVVVVVSVLVGRSGGDPGSAASPAASASASNQPGEVAAALRKLPTSPETVVADGARKQLAGHAAQAVPPGSRVEPSPRSWAPDGVGGGTMLVTVTSPGHRPVTYAAVMVFEHGGWKVLATFPLQGSA